LAIKVDDAKTLQATLNKVLNRLLVQSRPEEVTAVRTQKQGREIVTLQIAGGTVNPSFAVTDDWLIAGLFPQVVESYFLRVDKKLTAWEPTKLYQEAFDSVPKEFQSISSSDPRKLYRALVGLAPAVVPAVLANMRNTPLGPLVDVRQTFNVADFPPAELVGRPLFPNVEKFTAGHSGPRLRGRRDHWGRRRRSGVVAPGRAAGA
jgi:hypothetical protein